MDVQCKTLVPSHFHVTGYNKKNYHRLCCCKIPTLSANVAKSMMDDWMDGKNNVSLTHPYHTGKSCSKFC